MAGSAPVHVGDAAARRRAAYPARGAPPYLPRRPQASSLYRMLVDGLQPAGSHETMWRDTGASSGLYLVRFEAAGHTATRRLVRIR